MYSKRSNLTDDFLTPPELVEAMGIFDLDPCASRRQSAPLARESYCYPEADGLLLPWFGSVFVNPPFSQTRAWVQRFVLHGDGVLLCPARVETDWFRPLWEYCDGIFFSHLCIKYGCPPGIHHAPGFFGGAFCAMGRGNAERLSRLPLSGVVVTHRAVKRASPLAAPF